MRILNIIFKLSDKKIIFLDKIEKTGNYITPLMLILLSISYAIKNVNQTLTVLIGGFSLIVMSLYLILSVYQYLRRKYLLWGKVDETRK
ncbi:hypothetical protein [Streptococcus agalactiae]|uniref:hypothetical protein n=1 Tax=Streptococcus agalactiae TaxID=1311 RepID=UPI003C75C5BB